MFILQAPAISPTTLKTLPKVEKAKEANEAEATTVSTSESITDSYKSSNLSTELDKYDLDKQNLNAANETVKKQLKYGKIGMITGGTLLGVGVIGTAINALVAGKSLIAAFSSASAFGAAVASTPFVPMVLALGGLALIGGFMLHFAGVLRSAKAIGVKEKTVSASPKENIATPEKGAVQKKGFFERLINRPLWLPLKNIFINDKLYNNETNMAKPKKMDLIA